MARALPASPRTFPGNETLHEHYHYVGKLAGRLRGAPEGGTLTTALFLVLCSFIVLENLTVLVAIWKNHKLHNRMYFFIGNLALCDLLAGVAYKVNILMSGRRTLSLSPTVWFLREGSMFVALGASTCSLLAIAIERHLTMIKMRPYDANKKHRVFLLIGMCWLMALALGALPILGWNCLHDLPDCSTILPLYSKKYLAFCVSVFTAILVTIVILYARIYCLVQSSSRRVASPHNSERSMALLRTVVIVLGVFIACWSPLFILFLVDVACKVRECAILFRAQWFIVLAVLNSAMNPVIYTLASREMRRAFFRLVCSCLVRARGARALPVPPAPDPSRSRSSGSNHSATPRGKEEPPPAGAAPCVTDGNPTLCNGVPCK